jgi:hypothetical protein
MKLWEIKVPNKPLAIAAIGDIQYTGKGKIQMGCSLSHLKDHLEWVTKGKHLRDHHVQWVGCGDYVDLMSPSNRDRYRMSGLYSSTKRVVDHALVGIVEDLAKILAPHMRGKTATLCRGHHWFHFEGWRKAGLPCEDTDRYLGALLGMEEKRNWGVTERQCVISFKWPNGAVYRALAMHGEGNGKSLAYGINKLKELSGGWDEIDLLISGHFHKLTAAKTPRLRVSPNGKRLLERDMRMITSGSLLRGYILDDELYPEQGQMPPLSLGSAAVSVYPKKKVDGHWEFETVSLER